MEKLHSEEQEGIILTSQLKPNNFIVIQRLPFLHLQNRSQQRTHPWVQEQVSRHKSCKMLRQRAAWHHLRTCNHFWKAERCKHTQHLTTWQQKSTVFIGLQNLEDAHWFTQCKPVPNNPKTYWILLRCHRKISKPNWFPGSLWGRQSNLEASDLLRDIKIRIKSSIEPPQRFKFYTLPPPRRKTLPTSPNGSSMQSSGRSRNYILFGWWSGWRVSASRMNK